MKENKSASADNQRSEQQISEPTATREMLFQKTGQLDPDEPLDEIEKTRYDIMLACLEAAREPVSEKPATATTSPADAPERRRDNSPQENEISASTPARIEVLPKPEISDGNVSSRPLSRRGHPGDRQTQEELMAQIVSHDIAAHHRRLDP